MRNLKDVELEAEYLRGMNMGCLMGLIFGLFIGVFVMWITA